MKELTRTVVHFSLLEFSPLVRIVSLRHFIISFPLVYNQMEDQLVALGERWAHICQWAEERWSKLHLLVTHHTRIHENMHKIQSWIETNETIIKQMESEPVIEFATVFDRMKQLKVWLISHLTVFYYPDLRCSPVILAQKRLKPEQNSRKMKIPMYINIPELP